MKKFNKVMALTMVMAMGLSLTACGGGSTNTRETGDAATQEQGADADSTDSETTGGEQVTDLEMPAEDGETIYVYSWNTELGDGLLKDFKEKYPQYANRVEYVNLGVDGTDIEYQTQVDSQLQAGSSAQKYPSIIAADNDVALHWAQSDYTLPLADIGIGGEDLSNMYDYTLDYATYDGKLKALTWQATPGVVCYRTDIAEEVLGFSDRESVQDAISDWDKFFDVAVKMKEAGYKMVSGPDDVKYPLADSKASPWVKDDILNIDPWVTNYLETAKKLYDGDFTNKTSMWSDAWKQGMDDNVFCYFGCTWFLYWSLLPDNEDGTNDAVHVKDYNICEGPQAYHWGGTYLTVGKDCPDPALAALVLKTICCDTDVLQQHCEDTSDFVNNKQAVDNLIDAGKGASDKCGGDNPLPIFKEAAAHIDLSNATQYDAIFNGYTDTASKAYNAGEIDSVDDAIKSIKNQISDGYNYITVE